MAADIVFEQGDSIKLEAALLRQTSKTGEVSQPLAPSLLGITGVCTPR